MAKCCICQKGPAEIDGGVSVYRINAKGVAGIYACAKHIEQTDATVDPETVSIVRALEGSPATTSEGEGG